MENSTNENLKMGVDQVKTIFDGNKRELGKDVVTNGALNGLCEAEILATKALLDSVMQSSKDVASMLQLTPESKDKQACIEGENEKTGDVGHRRGSDCPSQPVKRSGSDVITLTLEPMSQLASSETSTVRKTPYYSKVNTEKLCEKAVNQGEMAAMKITGGNAESAVERFQVWHAKHTQQLVRASAVNSATSKLKAIACKTLEKLPISVASQVTTGPRKSQVDLDPQKACTGQKRKYLTISNHYFQYLNRPKYARHNTLQIVFKAQVILDTDVKNRPVSHTLFPKTFVQCSSGKTPLPGYKAKRPLRRIENVIPKKKKRTEATYRVPRPKFSERVVKYNPFSMSRKPILPSAKKCRFFSTEKLKWDSLTKRYVVQSQHQPLQQTKGQWFTFPSASSKVASVFSYNAAAAKKKFGSSGLALLSSSRSNFLRPIQNRTLPPPVKILNVVRDINVIFKCSKPPKPRCFKKFEDYSAMSFLFQIRKLLAARTMRFGYVEGKTDTEPKADGESHMPVKRNISHRLVLISTQNEATLAAWSSSLPRARELDNVNNGSAQPGTILNLPSDWLHVCKGGVVEELPENEAGSLPVSPADEKVLKEARCAWLHDNLSDSEESSNDDLDGTQCTGGPSHTFSSHVDLRNFHSKSRSKLNNGFCGSVTRVERGKPACSGQGRTQRSLSQVRTLHRRKDDVRKEVYVLPQPSYCVRYRSCFCAFECKCWMSYSNSRCISPAKVSRMQQEMVFPTRPKLTTFCQSGWQSSGNLVNGVDSSYEFSEKSHVPLISLKSSKWDARSRRFRSRSAVKIEKSHWQWTNGFERKGKLVKKIGATEIYHKWAVRRFSAPESTSGTVVQGGNPRVKTVESSGSSRRKPTLNEPRPGKCQKHDSLREENSFSEWNCTMRGVCSKEAVATRSQASNSFPKGTERPHACEIRNASLSAKSTVGEATRPEGSICKDGCLYSLRKPLLSTLGAFVRGTTDRRQAVDAPRGPIVQQGRDEIKASTVSTRNQNLRDVGDMTVRHLSNPIGRNHSKQKHVSENAHKQSLVFNSTTGEGMTVLECGDSPSGTTGMGNSFRKQGGNSPVLGSNFSETRSVPLDGKKKMPPVLANGLLTAIKSIERNISPGLTDCKREVRDKYECKENQQGNGVMKDSLSDELKLNAMEIPGKNSVHGDDMKRVTRSSALKSRVASAYNSEVVSPSATPKRDGGFSGQEICKDSSSCRSFSNSVKAGTREVVLEHGDSAESRDKTESKQPIVELDLPVETRSSRRLRSRVNNKRGRYETDYVADIPKANKKPKRILPSQDYDNDDFWQFYRDHENTVYSKNLILQTKYIKLLKKNGIKCSMAGSQTALFSSVVCASSSMPKSSTATVPDDGLMPFTKRLTKPRKTPQELPSVADGHCAYCGRSFVDEDKQLFNLHVARHGMRYSMLSAPQMPKKKKVTKNGRRDFVYRRRGTGNNKTAAAGSDPTEHKPPRRFGTSSATADETDCFEPLPKPSHLTMGHRKQTARKSFSLASTLPKDKLIAALECSMRAQSTITGEKSQSVSAKPGKDEQRLSPTKTVQKSPTKSAQSNISNSFIEPLPKPHSARKTLTGLPITYNHLNRSLHYITFPNKASK